MAQKKNDSGMGNKLGLGIALAAATAAGYFFLYGKNAPKNRKKLRGWMLKMKGEVVERMEKMKDVNEDVYHATIDTVAKKYQTLKDVSAEELDSTVKELKGHWASIKKEIAPKPKKIARKTAARTKAKSK